MHEKRNFGLVLLLAGALLWGVWSWVFMPADAALLTFQRIASVALGAGAGLWLLYALRFEDKLPNYMRQFVGEVYFEADGLLFLPLIRMYQGQPELCVFYLNRFENPVQAIVHLRPLHESFEIRPGWRDVHFAFRADGGDFGAIHLPIVVPDHLRSQVVDFQLAAATYYPRSHGARLLREPGVPCGSVLVDWGGAAFHAGVHEVSGEIQLITPVVIHLSMPDGELDTTAVGETWRQERIHAYSE